MTTKRTQTQSTLKRFIKGESGNVALMTAVTSLVFVAGLAVAIDISRGVSSQVNLADASDAVALTLAKSGLEDDAELRALAEQQLAVLYPGEAGERLVIEDIRRDGDSVTVVLADVEDAAFAGVFGRNTLDVGAGSTAIYSEREMDIAFVLDTSESMKFDGKMTALKSAATDMVETVEGYDTTQIRMSVVPFQTYVNVGTSRRNEPWLRVDADTEYQTTQCRNRSRVISRTNCRQIPTTSDRDGVIVEGSRRVCDVRRGPTERVCGPVTKRRKWNGCVGSRAEPMDTRPQFGGDRIPGLMGKRCGTELQEPTSDLDAVKSTIKAMRPSGNTYMPAGLAWGWRTLDTRMPLASAPTKADKVMILMTDGDNSRAKAGELHELGSRKSDRPRAKREADRKTAELCKAIKADEITVYTIAYAVKDAPTRTLLQDCASSGANYFDARNAEDLSKAFREIGDSLNQLRITA